MAYKNIRTVDLVLTFLQVTTELASIVAQLAPEEVSDMHRWLAISADVFLQALMPRLRGFAGQPKEEIFHCVIDLCGTLVLAGVPVEEYPYLAEVKRLAEQGDDPQHSDRAGP